MKRFIHIIRCGFTVLFLLVATGSFAQTKTEPAQADTVVKLLNTLVTSVDSLKNAPSKADSGSRVLPIEVTAIIADTTEMGSENAGQESGNRTLNLNRENLGVPNVDEIITPSKIFWTIVFLLLGYVFIRLISGLLNRIGEKSTKYRIAIKRLIPIIKIVGWIFVVFVILQGIIRPPRATVFAFFTSIGVAVGFAAQDLLKNIFGGLMILFDRPFQIGDKIEVGGSYGEVTKIGLRSTRNLTADDSEVSVPNAEMMNSSISNSNSGQTNCQVVAEIYLPIDVDTQRVRKIAIESALVSKYIFLNKPVAVIFVNEMHQRKSLLKMRLKAYVSDIRYEFAFKSDMTEIVLKELVKEGIIDANTL